VVRSLRAQGLLLASAESLTGGLLGARVTSVPGASAAYVGGVVSYSTDVKRGLLGVPEEVVAGPGVVSAACAEAMAAAVRGLLGSDVGVSTTGVAGPDPQEGKPVGLVYVGYADAHGVVAVEHHLAGDREEVRAAAVDAALALVRDRLAAGRNRS
jgi:nicotinamide-nucleotide amidase